MPFQSPERSAPSCVAIADAVAGVEARAGRNQPHRVRARPEMLAHHLAVALETATGEDHGVGGQRLDRTALRHGEAGDAAVVSRELLRGAAVTKRHAGKLGRPRQRLDEGRPAADRLDTRRPFRQIVARLNELDAVRGDPGHGRRRVLGEAGEIALVALELGGDEHVVHEARLDAVGRGHAHVGRRPQRVAAGFGLRGFVDQRNADRDAAAAHGFGGRQRGGKTGRTLADDDEVARCGPRHSHRICLR